jgi:hypothetical protein
MRLLPETAAFVALSYPAFYFYSHIAETEPAARQLTLAAGLSLLAFLATLWLVPIISRYLTRRGLKGRDMGRRGTPDESKEVCVRLGARGSTCHHRTLCVALSAHPCPPSTIRPPHPHPHPAPLSSLTCAAPLRLASSPALCF